MVSPFPVKQLLPECPEGACSLGMSPSYAMSTLLWLSSRARAWAGRSASVSPPPRPHLMPCAPLPRRQHLQSAQHRSFALEAHLYAEVDRIIAQLSHSFADIPFQAGLPR